MLYAKIYITNEIEIKLDLTKHLLLRHCSHCHRDIVVSIAQVLDEAQTNDTVVNSECPLCNAKLPKMGISTSFYPQPAPVSPPTEFKLPF